MLGSPVQVWVCPPPPRALPPSAVAARSSGGHLPRLSQLPSQGTRAALTRPTAGAARLRRGRARFASRDLGVQVWVCPPPLALRAVGGGHLPRLSQSPSQGTRAALTRRRSRAARLRRGRARFARPPPPRRPGSACPRSPSATPTVRETPAMGNEKIRPLVRGARRRVSSSSGGHPAHEGRVRRRRKRTRRRWPSQDGPSCSAPRAVTSPTGCLRSAAPTAPRLARGSAGARARALRRAARSRGCLPRAVRADPPMPRR